MVKVGFIVEGDSEKIIIESSYFENFLSQKGYELVKPVINAKGGGNLLPQNIGPFIQRLSPIADKICVLTDLENEPTISAVKSRIAHSQIDVIFITVKALEAWYLADTEAMKRLFSNNSFYEPNPESTPSMPYEYLKDLVKQYQLPSGLGAKPLLAKKMLKKYQFSIENAARHPNCASAKKFINYW